MRGARIALAGVVAALTLVVAAPASAATVSVPCGDVTSLTADIAQANLNLGGTLVLAPHCNYILSSIDNYWYGPNGLPPIASPITIEGNGSTIARTTNTAFRFFFVGADPAKAATLGYTSPGAGSLTLRRVTLSNGLAVGADGQNVSGGGGGGMGGAIYNQGALALDSVTLTANIARGGGGGSESGSGAGGGGGIGAPPGLSFVGDGSGFGGLTPFPGALGGTGSATGGGGGGGGFAGDTGANGAGNHGGNGGGTATGTGGGVVSSLDGAGGDGSGGGGFGSGGAATGGIGGRFGVGGLGATGVGNAGGGAGGVGGGGGGGHNFGDGGAGGFGGGGGASGLNAGTGTGGAGGFGGGGGGSSVKTAAAPGGFGGGAGGEVTTGVQPALGPAGGGAGLGGAIFNHQGTVTVTNSTISGNGAFGGTAGTGLAGVSAASPGQGLGGALFNLDGAVIVVNATVAGNFASGGGNALYNLAYDEATARHAATIAANSIISDVVSAQPATVADGGPNKSTAVASTTAHDIVGGNPRLGPLRYNGGPGMLTMAIGLGSPAVSAGRGCPSVDERGARRPPAACDAGAYQALLPPSISSPSAHSITAASAVLRAKAKTGGRDTTVTFFYGRTSKLGSRSKATDIGAGTSSVTVNTLVKRLKPGSRYFFKAVASNADGTASVSGRFKTTPLATISHLNISPSSFRAADGAKVSFKLNVRAKVRFTVLRRGKNGRFRQLGGATTITFRPGQRSFHFKRGGLAIGDYKLAATPTALGVSGRQVKVAFTITG